LTISAWCDIIYIHQAHFFIGGDKIFKINMLTIINKFRENGLYFYNCLCDCGTYKKIRCCHVNSGRIKSCGCYAKTKHKKGIQYFKTRNIWKNMKQRCINKNNLRYKDYGGRGICVSEEWQLFKNFLLDMGECPIGFSIERIDNDGNYCKENCKWIPKKEQAKNRRKRRCLNE
jgi:hypothetical protein